MLTVQIVLSVVIGGALLVPLYRIVSRMRRDEADEHDKTAFIVLAMSLVFFLAFLRWWFVYWLRNVV